MSQITLAEGGAKRPLPPMNNQLFSGADRWVPIGGI